ncbi:MAG: hypothetical protein AB2588_10545 [Candidatus Thiodiazotropha sp.]
MTNSKDDLAIPDSQILDIGDAQDKVIHTKDFEQAGIMEFFRQLFERGG